MQKAVVITGCSSGIGLATAVLLTEKGNRIYATMRGLGKKGKLADLTGDESVDGYIEKLTGHQ
jgi:NAD(P)-dependent dehydrogenase (short-subunit alcohol dehydrogenase family)